MIGSSPQRRQLSFQKKSDLLQPNWMTLKSWQASARHCSFPVATKHFNRAASPSIPLLALNFTAFENFKARRSCGSRPANWIYFDGNASQKWKCGVLFFFFVRSGHHNSGHQRPWSSTVSLLLPLCSINMSRTSRLHLRYSPLHLSGYNSTNRNHARVYQQSQRWVPVHTLN